MAARIAARRAAALAFMAAASADILPAPAAAQPAPPTTPSSILGRPTTCHNYGSTQEVIGLIARVAGSGPGSDARNRQVWVMRIEAPFCMRQIAGEPGESLANVRIIQLILRPEDFPRYEGLVALPRLRATGKLVARRDPQQQSLVVLEVTRIDDPARP
jgi:hypothetical protein